MSDEQTTTATDDTPQKQYGIAWGDEIDETRKQELWARLRAWWDEADHGERVGPFAGERLTGAEVYWLVVALVADIDWSDEEDPEQRLREVREDRFVSDALDLSVLCLQGANLTRINLQGAYLSRVQLQDAVLKEAHLERSVLSRADLMRANLAGAHLDQADLTGADLKQAHLVGAYLEQVNLSFAELLSVNFRRSHLQGANFTSAFLENANFIDAQLDQANLSGTNLQKLPFRKARLRGADLSEAQLQGADLREAFFDEATSLRGARFSAPEAGNIYVADVRWGDVNLAALSDTWLPPLGDEQEAMAFTFVALKAKIGKPIPSRSELRKHFQRQQAKRLGLFRAAVRANRQVAVALQNQGMNDEAGQFAYRAQLMQRAVYRYSGWRALGQWLFSWFLWLIAGYGYRPGRSVIVYLASVALFAVGYFVLGVTVGPHLSPYEAAVVSLTAFHGRGFFATAFKPSDPQAGLAALEAVFGLLIEISFIATFTQRFFGAK